MTITIFWQPALGLTHFLNLWWINHFSSQHNKVEFSELLHGWRLTLQAAIPDLKPALFWTLTRSPSFTLIAQGLSHTAAFFPFSNAGLYSAGFSSHSSRTDPELRPSLDGQRRVFGSVPKSPHVQGVGGCWLTTPSSHEQGVDGKDGQVREGVWALATAGLVSAPCSCSANKKKKTLLSTLHFPP